LAQFAAEQLPSRAAAFVYLTGFQDENLVSPALKESY